MSLRPPLHVSTFHSRTVVSMFGRLCHLFVHALSSLQVPNAQCMTLRSLAPCLRAAREKHRFAAEKKHRKRSLAPCLCAAREKHRFAAEKNIGTGKNTFGSRKKTPCSGKKLFPQREKTPAKNATSQREKFKAAEKTPCSSTKAPLQQKKCILEAAGKNRPRREKTRPRQEKNWPRQEKKPAAEKVQLCNPKSCRNGKNTFPQREKAAAPPSRDGFFPPRTVFSRCLQNAFFLLQRCFCAAARCFFCCFEFSRCEAAFFAGVFPRCGNSFFPLQGVFFLLPNVFFSVPMFFSCCEPVFFARCCAKTRS